MTAQAKYYEAVAATLRGNNQELALRSAQDHLDGASKTYLADFRRLQGKLIACLDDK